MNKKHLVIFGVIAITISFITTSVFAANTKTNLKQNNISRNPIISRYKTPINPIINGTVKSINGNIIIVDSKKFGRTSGIGAGIINPTQTSTDIIYTVDASSAVFNKFTSSKIIGVTPKSIVITISDVKIGDTLIIRGTVNGANILAKNITDGWLLQNTIHPMKVKISNYKKVSAIKK